MKNSTNDYNSYDTRIGLQQKLCEGCFNIKCFSFNIKLSTVYSILFGAQFVHIL